MSFFEHGYGTSDNVENGAPTSGQGSDMPTSSLNFGTTGNGNANAGYGQAGAYGQAPYNGQVGSRKNKPKKNHPIAKKIALAAVIAVVFGAVGGAAFEGSSYLAGRALGKTGGNTVQSETEGAALSRNKGAGLGQTSTSTATTVTDVSDIVKNVMPAIVQVTNMGYQEYQTFFGTFQKPSESAGSGIIISQDSDYIYIATNNHVVSDSTSLTVTFANNTAVSGEVQGTDPNTDLAVVKVRISDIDSDTMSAIKVATIGSSKNLTVGESAVVIGNALGYGQSVTTGVISALDRQVTIQGEDGQDVTNRLIQTDAAVNPGNSGGALLNMNGEVIGIVSAKYADTSVEGMGYAIPISSASTVIQSLIKGEKVTHEDEAASSTSGAYLGIFGMNIDSQTAMSYHLPAGVYVTQVIEGQAAEKAGIRRGDVITSLNGTSIATMQQLKASLSTMKAGDKVKVGFAQSASDYKTKTVEVTLGSSDEAPEAPEEEGK